MISFCHFPSLFIKEPDLAGQFEWAEVAKLFEAHAEYAAKSDAPLFSFIELNTTPLWPRGHVKQTGVKQVHAAVVDLDDLAEGAFEDILAGLAEYELRAYTTFSHSEGQHKWRIILPLAEPVQADRWLHAWHHLASLIPGLDPSCKDPTRLYYMPSGPAGAVTETVAVAGRFLKLDPGYPLPRTKRAVALPVSRGTLESMATRWGRSNEPAKVELGAQLAAVTEGVPFATHGEGVNSIAFNLVGAIVREFPEVKPSSLAEAFALSIERLQLDGSKLTTDEIEVMATRHSEYIQDQSAQKHKAEADARAFLLAESGRDSEYSSEELTAMRLSMPFLDSAWILQMNARYFVLCDKLQYKETSAHAIGSFARKRLAAAPFELTIPTANGTRPMSPAEMVDRHGSVVTELRKSMILQYPTLTDDGTTLNLPVATRREIEPQESAEVGRWLELLGGEALLDWLALAPDLSRPMCALVMTGDGGAGKSLLAAGLARIWTIDGCAKLVDLMSNFNSCLEKCPVVLGDELIPRDGRNRPRTEELRELIQQRTRPLNPKHQTPYQLEGAARFILTANNDSLLETSGRMSSADVRAIAERFLCVDATQAPTEYLKSLGGREHIQKQWLEDDALAGHILWLAVNRGTEYRGRFGVATSSDVVKRINVRNSLRSSVLEVILQGLIQGQQDIKRSPEGVVVTVQLVLSCWDAYRQDRKPQFTQLASVLRELGIEGEAAWSITTRTLLDWLEACPLCTPAELNEYLSRSSSGLEMVV